MWEDLLAKFQSGPANPKVPTQPEPVSNMRVVPPTFKVMGMDLPNPEAVTPDTSGTEELPAPEGIIRYPSGEVDAQGKDIITASTPSALQEKEAEYQANIGNFPNKYQALVAAKKAGVGQPLPANPDAVKLMMSAEDQGIQQSRIRDVGTDDPKVSASLAERGVVDLPTYEEKVGKRTAEGTLTGAPNSLDALQRRVVGTAQSVAALPQAAYKTGEKLADIGSQWGSDIASDYGVWQATRNALGIKPDDIGGYGEYSKAKGGAGGSIWQGLINIPAEVESMGMGVLDLADKFTAGGTPVSQKSEQMAEGVTELAKATGKSFAKTIMDPQKAWEEGALETLLNATMVGGALRKGASAASKPVLNKVAQSREAAWAAAGDAKAAAEAAKAAAEGSYAASKAKLDQFVSGPVMDPAKIDSLRAELGAGKAALKAADDGVYAAKMAEAKAADKLGNIWAYRSTPESTTQLKALENQIRNDVEPLKAQQNQMMAEADKAVQDFNNALRLNNSEAMAKAVQREHELRIEIDSLDSQISLSNTAKSLIDIDKQIAKNATAQAVLQAVGRIPEHVLTMGTTAAYDAVKYWLRKVINDPSATKYFRRWLTYTKDNRLPPEFVSRAERVASEARSGIDQTLIDTLDVIPEKHRPLVRDVMQAEVSPLFDGPGGKSLIEWDNQIKRWKLTPEGEAYQNSHKVMQPSGVSKMDGAAQRVADDLDAANKYARPLAIKSIEMMDDAKAVGYDLPADAARSYFVNDLGETVKRPYLPATFKQPIQTPIGKSAPVQVQEAVYGRNVDLATDVMTGLAKFGHDVAAHKLAREIAQDPTLFLSEERMAARRGINELVKPKASKSKSSDPVVRMIEDDAAKNVIQNAEGYIKVPNDLKYPGTSSQQKVWGDLAGGWLQGDVYMEMANAMRSAEQLKTTYVKALNLWKKGKTAYSVKTGSKNFSSAALVQAPLADMSLLNPMRTKYYVEAAKSLAEPVHTELYRMAVEDGLLDSGYATEIGKTVSAGEKGGLIEKTIGAPVRALGRAGSEIKQGLTRSGKAAPVWPAEGARHAPSGMQAIDKIAEKAWREGHFLKALKETGNAFTALLEVPVTAYGVNDTFFKLAKYARELELASERLGVPRTKLPREVRAAARKAAVDAYVDYSGLPGFGQVLRAPFSPVDDLGNPRFGSKVAFSVLGMPFVSYPIMGTVAFTRALKDNPWRAKMYMALGDYLTDLNRAAAGANEDEAKAVQEAMGRGYMTPVYRPVETTLTGMSEIQAPPAAPGTPWYAPKGGQEAIVPDVQREGTFGARDVRYLAPMSGYTPPQGTDRGVWNDTAKFLDSLGFGLPPVAQTIADVVRGKDSYTGKDIRKGSDAWENTKQTLGYVAEQLLPPTTPLIGSQWKLISESGPGGKPDYSGEIKPTSTAWSELLTGVSDKYTTPARAAAIAGSALSSALFSGEASDMAAQLEMAELRSSMADISREDEASYRRLTEEYEKVARPKIASYLQLLNRLPDDVDINLWKSDLEDVMAIEVPEIFYEESKAVLGEIRSYLKELSDEQKKKADEEAYRR